MLDLIDGAVMINLCSDSFTTEKQRPLLNLTAEYLQRAKISGWIFYVDHLPLMRVLMLGFMMFDYASRDL